PATGGAEAATGLPKGPPAVVAPVESGPAQSRDSHEGSATTAQQPVPDDTTLVGTTDTDMTLLTVPRSVAGQGQRAEEALPQAPGAAVDTRAAGKRRGKTGLFEGSRGAGEPSAPAPNAPGGGAMHAG